MKVIHTKGELVIEKREHGFYVCSGYKGFVITDVTGDQISHFIGNMEESEANAKLIASAPEMLETLNKLSITAVIIADNAPAEYKNANNNLFADFHNAYLHTIKVIKKATE